MDYKSDLNSDDDFDSSNGAFSDNYHSGSEKYRLVNGSGMSKAELRKTNKPIMEKRRRARINHCLNELKSLILEAMKKDPARHTKLEKADILEMTVKHLQSVQRQQLNMAIQTDPSVVHKFKTGFVECAEEVNRYVTQLEGVDTGVRQRLTNHLKNCATSLDQLGSLTNFTNGYRGTAAAQLGLGGGGVGGGGPAAAAVGLFGAAGTGAGLGNPLANSSFGAPAALFPTLPQDLNNNNNNNNNGSSSQHLHHHAHGAASQATPIQMGGVQLIPSRLPSGEFALIMPNTATAANATPFGGLGGGVVSAPFPGWPNGSATATLTNAANQGQQQQLQHQQQLNEFQRSMSAFSKPPTQQQQQQLLQQQQGAHLISGNNSIFAALAHHHHPHSLSQPHPLRALHTPPGGAVTTAAAAPAAATTATAARSTGLGGNSAQSAAIRQPPSTLTTSPPLSPISSAASLSSHGDDSIMHTSSDYAISRPATPHAQDLLTHAPAVGATTAIATIISGEPLHYNNSSSNQNQHNRSNSSAEEEPHNFSGVFNTPPPSSADSSTLSIGSSGGALAGGACDQSANSSVHLQQQQVSSTSGATGAAAALPSASSSAVGGSLKRSHAAAMKSAGTDEDAVDADNEADDDDDEEATGAADSSDCLDEPSSKKFAASHRQAAEEASAEDLPEKWERETHEKEERRERTGAKSKQRKTLKTESGGLCKLQQSRGELLEERDCMWRPW